MGFAVFTLIMFLGICALSGRLWWLVSSIRILGLFLFSLAWAIALALELEDRGYPPVFRAFVFALIAYGPLAWAWSTCAPLPGAGTAPHETQGADESSDDSPAEGRKKSLLRSWAKERAEFWRKKQAAAATPAEREKDTLVRDITKERIRLLAKKDPP